MMMFKWVKKGLLFKPQEINNRPGWMSEFAQAPNAIVFDDYVRVFFCCRPEPNEKKQFVSYCAFVDLDKNNLFQIIDIAEKPVLELGELGCFDEFGTYPVSVVKDNDDVVAFYGGWTRCESVPFNVSLGSARSTDNGKSFKKIGNGPVLSSSLYEPFVITSPKIRKYGSLWYLFYTSGVKWRIIDDKPEIIYKLRMAISDDGLNWEKINRNIIPDALNEDEAQACPDVIYKNGKYHMFFCYREAADFRKNRNNSYRIGYASSTDLTNWKRDDSKAGLGLSKDGWDSEMVAYPHVFELNGKIYMLYLGNEVGRYGFGLAELDGDLV